MVGLLQLIEAERRGDAVDRALIAQLLRCFSALGIYAEAFQAPFLQQTAEFYAAEGLQAMATMETGAHLLHCEVRSLPVSTLNPPWRPARTCCTARSAFAWSQRSI